MTVSRRSVLHMGAAALAAEAFGATIARALDIPAQSRTGTIRDVEHVVIFMQENRSFDHYFGALRGVRGFGDPRALVLPSGAPVFQQPDGRGGVVAPFRIDARSTSAEHIGSLDHSWKGSHARWKNWDAWIAAKTAMTMSYFTREDLPFYYALADAFTICDAYHCSIFGPTSPNRNFLFTGTSGLSAGYQGSLAVRNSLLELNETASPEHDSRLFGGLRWRTYAERLQEAGVSWKVYQEYDNYGDNSLAYFATFRGADADATLMERGRGCVAGSSAENARASRGEHLVAAFAEDVRRGTLPQVSWIVAPYIMCEHPSAGPGYGQSLTARLLAALVDNPEIWAKTVFLLNYDENDGFFDHVPPNLPALGAALGASTVSVAGESYHGEPVGLGPRVPMIAISPWSKGGWVNSQVFDHTSVIQFLERRFGVAEPNISPWRRAVCGDLTSMFDFATPDASVSALPDAGGYIAAADATQGLQRPAPPGAPVAARQEPGHRPARALPYRVEAQCMTDPARKSIDLAIENTGAVGAAFNVYAASGRAGPWFFTVEAGKQLRHELIAGAENYDFAVHGPNGFWRRYRGAFGGAAAGVEVLARCDAAHGALVLAVRNGAPSAVRLSARMRSYGDQQQAATVDPGQTTELVWPASDSGHWYDVEIVCESDRDFAWRFAGHIETAASSTSDPLIGAA